MSRLRFCVPQWHGHLRGALLRAKQRLSHAHVDGADWYWPAGEHPQSFEPQDEVRLLAPFDPVVWDRRRFEIFWGWGYRFKPTLLCRSANSVTMPCQCSGATA